MAKFLCDGCVRIHPFVSALSFHEPANVQDHNLVADAVKVAQLAPLGGPPIAPGREMRISVTNHDRVRPELLSVDCLGYHEHPARERSCATFLAVQSLAVRTVMEQLRIGLSMIKSKTQRPFADNPRDVEEWRRMRQDAID